MLPIFPIGEIQRLLVAAGRSVDSRFTAVSIDNARMSSLENARRRALIEELRPATPELPSSVRSA